MLRVCIGAALLLAMATATPALAQFASCQSMGGAPGVCTCPDGVTVVSNASACPLAALPAPVTPCPPDQYREGDTCRCLRPDFVPDAASHSCVCPPGKVLSATARGVACLGPCPSGQARDAGGVCVGIGPGG